jgi:hypothetical protein
MMSPTFAIKETRRYRYYVSRALAGERLSSDRKIRVPAGELESVVIEQLVEWLRSGSGIPVEGSSVELHERRAELELLANQLEQGSMPERRAWLLAQQVAIELGSGKISIGLDLPSAGLDQPSRTTFVVNAKLFDRGSDLRLMVAPDGSHHLRKPDAVLLKLLTRAYAARDALITSKPNLLTSDYSQLHRNRLARLSYLAPDIVNAIIEGRQPPSLSGRRLLRAADLPLDWQGQRALLGFA